MSGIPALPQEIVNACLRHHYSAAHVPLQWDDRRRAFFYRFINGSHIAQVPDALLQFQANRFVQINYVGPEELSPHTFHLHVAANAQCDATDHTLYPTVLKASITATEGFFPTTGVYDPGRITSRYVTLSMFQAYTRFLASQQISTIPPSVKDIPAKWTGLTDTTYKIRLDINFPTHIIAEHMLATLRREIETALWPLLHESNDFVVFDHGQRIDPPASRFHTIKEWIAHVKETTDYCKKRLDKLYAADRRSVFDYSTYESPDSYMRLHHHFFHAIRALDIACYSDPLDWTTVPKALQARRQPVWDEWQAIRGEFLDGMMGITLSVCILGARIWIEEDYPWPVHPMCQKKMCPCRPFRCLGVDVQPMIHPGWLSGGEEVWMVYHWAKLMAENVDEVDDDDLNFDRILFRLDLIHQRLGQINALDSQEYIGFDRELWRGALTEDTLEDEDPVDQDGASMASIWRMEKNAYRELGIRLYRPRTADEVSNDAIGPWVERRTKPTVLERDLIPRVSPIARSGSNDT